MAIITEETIRQKHILIETKARSIHGDKYQYIFEGMVYNKTKITIVCPIHGEFKQAIGGHINAKRGCKFCGFERVALSKRKSPEKFFEQANKTHNNYYDYSESVYIADSEPIDIICPKHGKFTQTANNHLHGYGCSLCGYAKAQKTNSHTFSKFIEKSKLVHGDIYDYPDQEYFNNKTHVSIICRTHGEFYVRPDIHISKKNGCPKCSNTGTSKDEQELTSFVRSIYSGELVERDRSKLLKSCTNRYQELDIYLPTLNIGIEYCGMFWHSEYNTGKQKHQQKFIMAQDAGLRLITIYESEWIHNRGLCEKLINRVIGNYRIKFSTSCAKIVEVDVFDANKFVKDNSFCDQISVGSTIYGLVVDDMLVHIMAFNNYEITHNVPLVDVFFPNSDVILLNNIIKIHNKNIKTKINNRWDDTFHYERLGFVKINLTEPKLQFFDRKLNLYDTQPDNQWFKDSMKSRIYDCGYTEFLLNFEGIYK